ncbi:MAG: tetratricopeptide repeat protein [Candidatus Promineifilaceae bacterium]|nr:tetratricopeptide repeat protein [Candidatus Promineifilaceae bacterium]
MAGIPVTRTKVVVPGRRADVLPRQRLLDLFYGLMEHRLVILAAPAGYGKTTLLVDFAHHVELPVCWFAMDALDKEPRRFVSGFIAAIAQRFPEFGKQSSAVLENMSGEIDWEQLVTIMVNDAYENIRDHFLLVLDDYHFADESEEINYFINQFVQHVDENCHLVLSTRKLPALPDLPLMVARSEVGGLGFQALAFRRDEIRNLILQNYNLTITREDAEELAQQTEGWITGLLLSAQTMGRSLTDRVRVARVSGVGLYDYLAQQVLELQSSPMREFLMRSALLEEFDAALCRRVLEGAGYRPGKSWKALIEEALRRNLFIQTVGEGGQWVRYHHLFQDFLQTRMAERHPEETRRIRRRLAVVYTERGEWERAYQLYDRLGNFETTADFIVEAGMPMLDAARQATLAEWIDSLPPGLIDRRPRLLSLRGTADVYMGQAAEGLTLLDRAAQQAEETGDLYCQAQALARRASAHRALGDYQAALADADEALQLASPDAEFDRVRVAALRGKGLSLYYLGQFSEAASCLQEARALNERLGNALMVTLLYDDLGRVYHALGSYEEARQAFTRALDACRENGYVMQQRSILNNLGVLHHFLGDYEEAAVCLEEAVSVSRKGGYRRSEAAALIGIGDLYADLDAPEAALDAYHQARAIVSQIDFRFLHHYINLAEAAVLCTRREFEQAQALLQSVADAGPTLPTSLSGQYHLEMGRLLLAGNRPEDAVDYLRDAVRQYGENDQPLEAACASIVLAAAHHAASEEEAALAALQEALRGAADLPHSHPLLVAGRRHRSVLEWAQEHAAVESDVGSLLDDIDDFEDRLPQLRRKLRQQATEIPFAPPTLIIQTLGKARVEMGGKLVTRSDWQTPMAPEMLFLLLAHPKGLTKEEIGATLWPDRAPQNLKVNFQKTIYRLRRALDQDVVMYDEATSRYHFNWELDYRYDVDAFRAKLQESKEAAETSARIAAYEEALRIYRGPYLPEAEGTWVMPEREALAEAHRQASLALARLYLAERQPGLALQLCRRLLAEDPCLEEAHRLAMRAHAARGNMAAVVRQFEACQRALQEEIQVLPSSQTVDLYSRLTQSHRGSLSH